MADYAFAVNKSTVDNIKTTSRYDTDNSKWMNDSAMWHKNLAGVLVPTGYDNPLPTTLYGRNIIRETISTAITTTAITNIACTNAAIFKDAKTLHVLASNSLKDAGGVSLPVKIAFNGIGIKFTDGTYAMQSVIKTAQAERVGFIVPGIYNTAQGASPAGINIMLETAVLGTSEKVASEKGFEWINSGLYINARVEGDVAPASGSLTIMIAGEVA